MNRYIIFGLATVLLAGCDRTTSGAIETGQIKTQSNELSRPASDTVDAFHAALAAGDTKQALALLADDVLIYEGGGAEESKAEYASHHLEADMAFLKGVKQSTVARSAQVRGDVAWVMSQGKTIGTFKDKAVDSASTETMVLRRFDGVWKIVHIHWSAAATKPKAPTS